MHSVADISATIGEAARDFDIDRVYLFGSYARNEATACSDIDLCLETGAKFSLLNAGEFSQRLEREFGLSIDLVTERSLYDFARTGLHRDRVLVYERA